MLIYAGMAIKRNSQWHFGVLPAPPHPQPALSIPYRPLSGVQPSSTCHRLQCPQFLSVALSASQPTQWDRVKTSNKNIKMQLISGRRVPLMRQASCGGNSNYRFSSRPPKWSNQLLGVEATQQDSWPLVERLKKASRESLLETQEEILYLSVISDGICLQSSPFAFCCLSRANRLNGKETGQIN